MQQVDSDGTESVVSVGANVLPSGSAQGFARVSPEQPTIHGEALRQNEVQSRVSVQHGAQPASKTSSAAQVALVHREAGMKGVSEPAVTTAPIDVERWAPQDTGGKQSQSSARKIAPNHFM